MKKILSVIWPNVRKLRKEYVLMNDTRHLEKHEIVMNNGDNSYKHKTDISLTAGVAIAKTDKNLRAHQVRHKSRLQE